MVVKDYKWSLLVVVACTFITPVATLSSTLFTKTLIDDYIIPLTQAAQPDYTPLAMAIGKLAVILTAGALCAYLQSRLMINVSQGTLLRLRRDTFSHMQQLPVNYFDQHAHGDIMSVYTNDIDTLRQMISTLPNIFSSVVTIVITFASMIVLSWPLTLLTVIMSVIMMYTTRKLGNISASHFRRQQQSLGELNGFVEEMLTGQKVVKTFCHEESAIEQFSRLNDQLRDSACNANRVANIVMPVNGNLSNLIYVMAAIFGAMLALNYFSPATTQGLAVSITIGTLVSFLTLIKNFTRPVSEISNQINSVINAVAGADRVFAILDAPEEKDDDDADIRLVSAQLKDGVITESKEKTNIWAWKDSKGNYTRQQGEVDFFGVDFAYPPALDSKQPPKQVLFDITLDTEAGQKIAIVGGTGYLYAASVRPTSAVRSALCCRRRTSSPGPSWKTYATDGSTPPTKNASRPQSWSMPTTSSAALPTAIRPCSPATAATSRRVSASCWPLPGQPWPIPPHSFSTRPPRASTPAPSRWCSEAWTAS